MRAHERSNVMGASGYKQGSMQPVLSPMRYSAGAARRSPAYGNSEIVRIFRDRTDAGPQLAKTLKHNKENESNF